MNSVNEYKDNVIRFKEILLELHRGADPMSLYEQFHDVISNANGPECEEIKNQLIIEGVPKKRAKKWSRAHLLQQVN